MYTYMYMLYVYFQVCQHVVDARKGEDESVPAPLMARMIKYRILKQRMQDLASRESSTVKVSIVV